MGRLIHFLKSGTTSLHVRFSLEDALTFYGSSKPVSVPNAVELEVFGT